MFGYISFVCLYFAFMTLNLAICKFKRLILSKELQVRGLLRPLLNPDFFVCTYRDVEIRILKVDAPLLHNPSASSLILLCYNWGKPKKAPHYCLIIMWCHVMRFTISKRQTSRLSLLLWDTKQAQGDCGKSGIRN